MAVIIGGNNDDVLVGTGFADLIMGNGGNDTLRGGLGADVLSGGTGIDTASYSDSGAGVTISLATGVGSGGTAQGDQLGGIENLSGSAHGDSLTGDAQENELTGGGGADVLAGGGGADTLRGDQGSDHLDGGAGVDTLFGDAGDDVFVIDTVSDLVVENAGEGNDEIRSTVSFGLGSNIERGVLLETAGALNLSGNGLDNVLTGNSLDNFINGGAGNDTMAGGDGNDSYLVDSLQDLVVEEADGGTDQITVAFSFSLQEIANVENLVFSTDAGVTGTGNELKNRIVGRGGNDVLSGLGGDDVLVGGGGGDTLDGGSDDDVLDGGSGDDVMLGGAGNDTYFVDSRFDVVTEFTSGGVDTVIASIQHELSANVENLELAAGSGAINGSGNELDNNIVGNESDNQILARGGNDTVSGGGGDDFLVGELGNDILDGGDDDDQLFGDQGADTLFGGDGDDFLNGGSGNDVMDGGDGDDTYLVKDTADVVVEQSGEGVDTVLTHVDHVMSANVENLQAADLFATTGLTLTGNGLGNEITGNNGNDIIDGRGGADRLTGRDGNDSYTVDDVGDVVVEAAGQGNDTVFSTVDFTLGDNIETLSLFFGNGVFGTGNDLDNGVFGGAQDNVLDGRGGADTLNGFGGNDTFVFRAGEADGDAVFEFDGNGGGDGDLLRFEGYGTAAEGASFTQINATQWLIRSADGLVEETITLAGGPTVDGSDFVFV